MTISAAEQTEALRIAGELIDAGVPVFAAPPCPGATCPREGHATGKHEYDLPAKWQLTVPSRVWLERWQPGWALGAVGGHVADMLDEDPRHGGTASIDELKAAGHMPRVFGVQGTPSEGFHYLISPMGERETNAFMPGLDYQGGMPDGKGRAFVWIAPTVRKSKVAPYLPVAYRWLQEPDLDYLKEFDGNDESIEGLRSRVLARKVKAPGNEPDRSGMEKRAFTEEEAQRFCLITLERLEQAQRGDIENAANNAACQLSHFVPEFWSEEFAYAVLQASLSRTDYDPDHPASGWTAEKFHNVIAGVDGRAPADWEAVRKPETPAEVTPEVDDVDRLLAEMRKPSQVAKQAPPRMLVQGLLTMDSESWIIGAPGSKKSFVATDLAAHIAAGKPWQGLKVRQGRVVMIIAEGSGGMGPRIKAWEKENGAPMSEDIDILPRPVQAADLEKWAVLREACRRIGPALVVIDTQARVTVGLEENSAKEMGVYIEAVRSIREATGACVLSVHHTGRQGGDARGSSAIDGAQTTELKVESTPGALRGKLKSEKQKDLALAPDVELVFAVHKVGEDEDGQDITSLALVNGAFKKASGQEEAPATLPTVSDLEITKWGERMLEILVRDAPMGVGLSRAEVLRAIDVEWASDKPKTAARDWRTTKEAWRWVADGPFTEPARGMNLEVSDLEKRESIESKMTEKVGVKEADPKPRWGQGS